MDARSERVAARLNTPMMIAAALTLPAVALSETHQTGTTAVIANALNWITWLAFLAELLIMLAVVPDRRRWLWRNPLDLVIVILTPPVLPPGLQILRVLRLLRLLRLAQLSRQAFSLEGLRYAALLALFTVIAGGAAFVAFEKHNQHLTAWQGAYWAITTMTTVGSSIYPTTTGSQIVAVVIVIVGICFVALLTGAVAQRFLGPELADVEAELATGSKSAEAVAMRELKGVREQLQALELAMQRLVERREPD